MGANRQAIDVPLNSEHQSQAQAHPAPREYTIIYENALNLLYWHIGALYGVYLIFTTVKWATVVFNIILYVCAMLGVTAGTHRLWSHRSYRAKLPLQILLMLFHCMTFQGSIFNWTRNHRAHHKFCDTDADPHNPRRGFFFAHFGWLIVRKHPENIRKGQMLDVLDITENPVLQFQNKYNFFISTFLAFVLPVIAPPYFWQESIVNAHHVSLLRLISVINAVLLINSAAHKFGFKPYDQYMSATQNVTLSLATLGECFHNYHHVFPFDYRTAELGNNCINLTTKFIDFFAWVGWAYDMKYASDDMIAKRAERTGDGTDMWGQVRNLDIKKQQQTETADLKGREQMNSKDVWPKMEEIDVNLTDNIWGWGDKDMLEDDVISLSQ